MVIKIMNTLNRTSTSVEFHTDPWAYKTVVDGELRVQNRDSKDPEQRPPPEPDDSYLFIASIVGIILGGSLGVIIAINLTGAWAIVIGLIVGCIAGGIIGAYIGSYLKNRKRIHRGRF
jgi:VIT1/CCC1 family predicted Fe2+/Mn2+ transporter